MPKDDDDCDEEEWADFNAARFHPAADEQLDLVLRLRERFSEGVAPPSSEAEEDIDSEAERQSYDAVYDYWVQGGGWRRWDGSSPPATNPNP